MPDGWLVPARCAGAAAAPAARRWRWWRRCRMIRLPCCAGAAAAQRVRRPRARCGWSPNGGARRVPGAARDYYRVELRLRRAAVDLPRRRRSWHLVAARPPAVTAAHGRRLRRARRASNFSFLDGASHPEELVQTAAALGLAGLGICDTNSLAGVVRGHVAAKEAGLPFAVGCRLVLADGGDWLAWPTDRAAYGRLTALLSQGRMRGAQGRVPDRRAPTARRRRGLGAGGDPAGWPDAGFAAQLRGDAAALRGRLALPLLLAASCPFRGDDRRRLDRAGGIAGGSPAAGHRRRPLPPPGPPPPGRRADRHPAAHHRGCAGLSRPSPMPSATSSRPPRWRGSSPATRRRWPTPCACWRRRRLLARPAALRVPRRGARARPHRAGDAGGAGRGGAGRALAGRRAGRHRRAHRA